jgi:hypothetical protein
MGVDSVVEFVLLTLGASAGLEKYLPTQGISR